MYDPHNPTPPRPKHPYPGNAFTTAFLDLLEPEDDPPTATEALAEGPWTVMHVAAPRLPSAEPNGAAANEAEPWAVVRAVVHATERPEDEPPAASFVHLHPARLATAAVAIAARDAAYRLDPEPDPRGFALTRDGRVVGHLPWHHQELVAALNHFDALARSPRAVAAVLQAAGASALRRVGALLAGRSA